MARILVVDDNSDLIALLRQRLERRGHVVFSATDADAGLASARAAHPDIALVGARPEGLDGWATAHAIKIDPNICNMRIIGLLASGSPDEQQLALTSGCDETHVKPVDLVRLAQQIDALIVRDSEPDAAPADEVQLQPAGDAPDDLAAVPA